MIVIAEHDVTVHLGDVRATLADLPAESVQCIVTSPPYYGLRDYGAEGQIGLEASPAEYVAVMVAVFHEARRVLAADGVLWLNLGDSYAGKANGGNHYDRHRGQGHRSKQGIIPPRINTTAAAPYKSLLGIPWRVALALVDDGWILRRDVIWRKPNAMPESVTDRPASSHEYLFMFTRSARYQFNLDAIRQPRSAATEDRYRYAFKANSNPASNTNHLADGGLMKDINPAGANPGSVWDISTAGYPGAHFACMPPELARRCILAGTPNNGPVLDPFAGSGTSLMVARQLGRPSVGIELKPAYVDIIRDRIGPTTLAFGEELA